MSHAESCQRAYAQELGHWGSGINGCRRLLQPRRLDGACDETRVKNGNRFSQCITAINGT